MGGGGPTQQKTTQTTSGRSVSDTTGATTGTSAGTTTSDIPEWLQPFLTGAVGTAGTALGDFSQGVGGYQVPGAALDELTKTAQGGYLYGGPGQQPFIDAAVRAAQPNIYSQFGARGPGGGGLERAALDQSAVDAYARLYQGERSNQLSAATALPGVSMLPLQLQQQLATLAGGLPGQFAPFLGHSAAGTESGTSTSHGTTRTSGTQTTTQPLYQDPWWKTALGVAGIVGGVAGAPFTGGMSLGAVGPGMGLLGGGGGGGMSLFPQAPGSGTLSYGQGLGGYFGGYDPYAANSIYAPGLPWGVR